MLAFVCLLPQDWFPKPLQPYEVRSASGEWTLAVQPSNPSGDGEMHVRLLKGEELSWAGDFAWTFAAAGVADDGTCVGYANGEDRLRIAVLDSDGVVRKQHDIEHTAWFVEASALPMATGPVLVHSKGDLALIRVVPAEGLRPPPWRAFRLSTGEAAPDVLHEPPLQPGPNQSLSEGDARTIGDTGLTLVHRWFTDWGNPPSRKGVQEGGVFALYDLQGQCVWSLARLDDYSEEKPQGGKRSKGSEGWRPAAQRIQGVIASAGPGSGFELLHVRDRARVRYAVEEGGTGGWTVKESARDPWVPAEERVVEPFELARLKSVSLRAGAGPAHPVHDVVALGFTEQGELELVRQGQEGPSYVRLRGDGQVVLERDLAPALLGTAIFQLFHDLAGDRWLVQRVGGEPPWVVLDVRTGQATPAPLPAGELGCHVAPLADGGYLALLARNVDFAVTSDLVHVRADGSFAWQHSVSGQGPDDTRFDRALSFAQGLARIDEHTFALLGSSEITRIDLDRNVLDSWDLGAVLGHLPGYLSGLLCDGTGGVLLREGDAFQRLDGHGAKTGSFVPKRADGSRDGSMDRLLCVAPDGRFWTSDGQRVYRLDETGTADLALGPELREGELTAPDQCAIDVLGRALVQDRATRAVHVFDRDGRRLAVCRLAPDERPADSVPNAFGGDPDGGLWVRSSSRIVRFDATGAPVGEERRASKKRESGTTEQGVLDAMQTRPDGAWLDQVAARAWLPDGRRMLLERPRRPGESAALHLYAADGAPLRTLVLPGGGRYGQASAGASWIVAGDYGPSWTLVRLADDRVLRFEPHLEGKGSWHIGQTPDGKTLLLLNWSTLELVSYELP